jgi:hypothetical protein
VQSCGMLAQLNPATVCHHTNVKNMANFRVTKDIMPHDDHVDGIRLRLSPAATNGSIVRPPGNM